MSAANVAPQSRSRPPHYRQEQAVQVHPVIVFLAVIAGGEIPGILGVGFAVPAPAVLRVLFDVFRARIRVSDEPVTRVMNLAPGSPRAGGPQ